MASNLASQFKLRVDSIGREVSRIPRKAPPVLVLLGDSLSEDNHIKELAGHLVINMGVRGDEIDHADGGVINRLNLLPLAFPAHVMLLVGLNDLANDHKTDESVADDYERLVVAIRRTVPSADLHLLEVLPTRGRFERHMPRIALLNVAIEEIAGRHGVKMLDTFSAMEDDDGHLNEAYSEDGGHLNDFGYEALNGLMEKHLKTGEAY